MEIEYDKLAQQLFNAHNKIREEPKSFIIKLKKWSKNFREKTLFLLNENPLETFEGVNAVEEAIRFLSVQKSVPKLNYSEELSKAAKDHAMDIGENNLHGHEGSDGSILSDRIERYTEWDESCAESIDLGFKTTADIHNVDKRFDPAAIAAYYVNEKMKEAAEYKEKTEEPKEEKPIPETKPDVDPTDETPIETKSKTELDLEKLKNANENQAE